MITAAQFYGSAVEDALDSNKEAYHPLNYRMQVWTPDAGSRALTLPDARDIHISVPTFVLVNASGSYDYEVKYNDGTTLIGTLAAGDAVEMYLKDNSTQNGVWYYKESTYLGG
jgi:hypothetical protein